MTTIISLYGGPGTGKSTSASFLYYLLKSQGINSELVREYVKDWAWEKRRISTYDQFYLVGKQIRRESLLYGKVDWIVTDSPVMLNTYYADASCPTHISQGVRALTLAFYRQAVEDNHRHVHVFLNRTKEYNQSGRYQTEDEAKKVDAEIRQLLSDLDIPFIDSNTDEESLKSLLNVLQK